MSYRTKQPQLSLNLAPAARRRPSRPAGTYPLALPPDSQAAALALDSLDINLPQPSRFIPSQSCPNIDSVLAQPPSSINPSSQPVSPNTLHLLIDPLLRAPDLIDFPPCRPPPSPSAPTHPDSVLTPLRTGCQADHPNLTFFALQYDRDPLSNHLHSFKNFNILQLNKDSHHPRRTLPLTSRLDTFNTTTTATSRFSPRSSQFSPSTRSASSISTSDSRPSLFSTCRKTSCLALTKPSLSAFHTPHSPYCASPTSANAQLQSFPPLSHSAILNDPTSASPVSSPASLKSSSDHHLALVSPDLPSPWPVPPSSSTTHFTFPSRWPQKKSNTYHPLRTWSNAPRPDPSVIASARPSLSTLAYLDLSSSNMIHVSNHPHTDNPQRPYGTNTGRTKNSDQLTMRFRPLSLISQNSDHSEHTIYQDASEKAEWLDIDTGDAYEDLEKTECIARSISQRLSLINRVDSYHRPKNQSRYQSSIDIGRAHDGFIATSSVSSGHSNHSLGLKRRSSISTEYTDRYPFRTSYSSPSCRNSPQSDSSLGLDHSDCDSTPLSRPRSKPSHHSLGSVPLFTRVGLSRDDKDEDLSYLSTSRREPSGRVDEDPLEAIQEVPGVEISEPSYPLSITPPSISNPRRRLKPLILRSTPSIVTNPKSCKLLASSMNSSSELGPLNPNESGSPKGFQPNPYPHRSSLSINLMLNQHINDAESWKWSEKASSSDESTLKDPEMSLNEPVHILPLKPSPLDLKDVEVRYSASKTEVYPQLALKDGFDHKPSTPLDFTREFGKVRSQKQNPIRLDTKSTNCNIDLLPSRSDESLDENNTLPLSQIPTSINDLNIPSLEIQRSLHDDSEDLAVESDILLTLQTTQNPSLRSRPRAGSLQTPVGSMISGLSNVGSDGLSSPGDHSTQFPRRRLSSLYVPRQALLQALGKNKSSPPPSCVKKPSHLSTVEASPPAPLFENEKSNPLQPGFSQPAKAESLQNRRSKNDIKMIRSSRLYMSISRMQAQDAKVLDVQTMEVENHLPRHSMPTSSSSFVSFKKNFLCDVRPINEGNDKKKIKGKFKYISKPALLDGDRERDALWKMISNRAQKFSSSVHRK